MHLWDGLCRKSGHQDLQPLLESMDLLVALGLSTGVYTAAELTCLQRRDSALIVLGKTQLKPPRVSTMVSLHLETQWEGEYREPGAWAPSLTFFYIPREHRVCGSRLGWVQPGPVLSALR